MAFTKGTPSLPPDPRGEVWLVTDSARPSPHAFSQKLAALTASDPGSADRYLQDGAVARLERQFADLLGKEACAFFPTGTLANMVAVRVLCGKHPRALCQADSHLYRDESDAVPRLTGINLVPLAPGRVAPTPGELSAAFEAAEKGPYPLKVGAISLESPVRRLNGRMIPLEELDALTAVARRHGARLHLDGARLLLAPPSLDVKAYAARFDTILVSLYKYLDAPMGAVLLGSEKDIAEAREWRHIHGGLIFGGWQCALLASDRLPGFRAEFARAHATAARLVAALEKRGLAKARALETPSNITLLELPEARAKMALERGQAAGIRLAPWQEGVMPLFANTSILRRPIAEYVRLFEA